MKHINLSKTLPEIFADVRKLDSVEEKAKLLRLYKNRTLAFYINELYNSDWSDVTVPNYRPSTFPPGLAVATIGTNIDRLLAVKRLNSTNPERAQELLLLVLETVTEDEAELLVNMIRNRRVEGISKAVFKRVYPEFFRPEDEAE